MDCPIDFITINENKVRVIAFFVLTLAIIYLFTGIWFIMAFLAIDFLLRVFNWGKFSLLAFLSDSVIKQLQIKAKPVDRAPKRFAAMVGLFFTTGILILGLLHFALLANISTIILCCFATLEAFAGFCAGCYVYSAGKMLLNKF
ncbi:MAG: DUF4395 domain-containing protein [Mucilaginibacter sp.]